LRGAEESCSLVGNILLIWACKLLSRVSKILIERIIKFWKFHNMNAKTIKTRILSATAVALLGALVSSGGHAASDVRTLVITNQPLPSILQSGENDAFKDIGTVKSLEKTSPVRVSKPKEVGEDASPMDDYLIEVETATTRRVAQLQTEYQRLESSLNDLATEIKSMQQAGRVSAKDYYASVAEIQTQLQGGTTPGNPRLLAKLKEAQENLEGLSNSISKFNTFAVKVGDVSSVASFLMQSVQATYGLSGAVPEDHERLDELEDSISNMVTVIERLLNTTNEEITRASGYLAAERRNLRTLALAVANGDVYGANISNRLYSQVNQGMFPVTSNGADTNMSSSAGFTGGAPSMMATPSEPKPLVVVKFDRPDVSYEQALYTAIGEAKDKYPGARFEIVAVDPGAGNAAQRAIEAAKAKRNAERVLRSMVQMGVNANDVVVSNASRQDARTSEVHVLIR
jgi:hypothetical protein